MIRHAAAVAIAAVLVVSCSDDGASPVDRIGSTTLGPTVPPSTTSTRGTRPGLDPDTTLVAAGYRFGTGPPSLRATRTVYRDDELVLDSAVALAWNGRTLRPVADVVVLALAGDALIDDEIIDAYVSGFASVMRRGDAAVRSFLHENLLTVLVGADGDAVDGLVRAMRRALAAGERGTARRSTPMRGIDAASVFVELEGAAFAEFPEASDTTVGGTPTTEPPEPPPPAPALSGRPGSVSHVAGRHVIVGGEVRAVAWALRVRTTAIGTAEELEPLIADTAAARAGQDAESTVVSDREVWAAGPAEDGGRDETVVRAFREANVVVLIEGTSAIAIDAIVGEWISALDAS